MMDNKKCPGEGDFPDKSELPAESPPDEALLILVSGKKRVTAD